MNDLSSADDKGSRVNLHIYAFYLLFFMHFLNQLWKPTNLHFFLSRLTISVVYKIMWLFKGNVLINWILPFLAKLCWPQKRFLSQKYYEIWSMYNLKIYISSNSQSCITLRNAISTPAM